LRDELVLRVDMTSKYHGKRLKSIYSLLALLCLISRPLLCQRLHRLRHPTTQFFILATLLSVTIMTSKPARAANIDWHYCGVPQQKLVEEPRGLFSKLQSETTIEANTITAKNREMLDLSGNVKFSNDVAKVSTEAAQYKISSQQLTTDREIRFETDYFVTVGDKANLTIGNRGGTIENARFWLPRSHMRGSADTLTLIDQSRTRLDNTFFTSCLEGNTDWELRASELIIDTSKNEGVAKHARLTLMSVPIFYFPYLSFALEGRKTGLLTPDYGVFKTTGSYFTLPYYINIAPNRDATVTPYFYEDRGIMVRTENRFLFPTASGKLIFDYLDHDKADAQVNEITEEPERGHRRFYSDFNLQSYPAQGWRTSIKYRSVSDNSYFNDFGDGYLQSNESYLERSTHASYQGDQWEFTAAVQSYQTIDSDILPLELPYQQLPSLHINLRELEMNTGLRYKMDMEYVNFYRKEGVVGRRIDIAPRLSWPYSKSAGYIKPAVTMRHTRYALNRVGRPPNSPTPIDDTPSRSVSQWTLDSGLFLERDFNLDGQRHIQTLEPRLFYLFIPHKNQKNLIYGSDLEKEITFDAGQPQLSYSQLFRNNRFNGIDKIGDANQITLALTSKLLTDQGLERLRVSLGQIHYFQDRKVSFPGSGLTSAEQIEENEKSKSDIVVELTSQWNKKLNTQAIFVWGASEKFTQSAHYQLRYQQNTDNIIRLNYRYEKGIEEQADATLLWRLRSRWKGLFHIRYSFRNDPEANAKTKSLLESYTGLEYQSCCWSLRILQREYQTEDNITNTSTWFQLELKGLTRVGNKLRGVFSNGSVSESF